MSELGLVGYRLHARIEGVAEFTYARSMDLLAGQSVEAEFVTNRCSVGIDDCELWIVHPPRDLPRLMVFPPAGPAEVAP